MFESPAAALTCASVRAMVQAVADGVVPDDETELIDLVRGLEELTCVAQAAQAASAARFDTLHRRRQAELGVAPEQQGRGVAAQVALARRESPHRGERHLGLAKILVRELPCTWAAFRTGRITEWKATLVARETACLSLEHRMSVDAALAADPNRIEAMGDAELAAQTRKLAYALDPHAVVARRAQAEKERHVSVRPLPDVMAGVNAVLPVADGVAVFAALKAAADQAVAAGDERTRGQLMADTLVHRVTGRDPLTAPVPFMVNVVVDAATLLGHDDQSAHLDGYGPVPAGLVRDLPDDCGLRLLLEGWDGRLIGMESGSRTFPARLAEFVRLRDHTCRTPWCDAPIRHTDHVDAHADGGPTSEANGQGLCEHCNHAKQAIGWTARPRPGPRHSVETVTPTGHRYWSIAPTLRADLPIALSRAEFVFEQQIVLAA